MEEEYFDYARCVDAPYWIQELKTPKGARIWVFSTPVEISFFIVAGITFLVLFRVFGPIISFLNAYFHHIFLPLYVYVPYWVAGRYVEITPQGKKVPQYLYDWLIYMIEFECDKRAIYQGERITEETSFVFEKTNL